MKKRVGNQTTDNETADQLDGFGRRAEEVCKVTLRIEHRLLVDLEVIEGLDTGPRKVRIRLLNQFYKIRSFPSNYSEYRELDAVGSAFQLFRSAVYKIYCRSDLYATWLRHAQLKTRLLRF
jgi:hypothetical protein